MENKESNLLISGSKEETFLANTINEGKQYILPERHDEWKNYVMSGAWGDYNVLRLIVSVMKCLSSGSIAEAHKALSEGNVDGFAGGYIRNVVLNFSILGPEFWKEECYSNELNPDSIRLLEEKKRENRKLVLKHFSEISPEVVKTLLERAEENVDFAQDTVLETEASRKI